MNERRRLTYKSGRLMKGGVSEFLSPTLTVKDPQIPNLPLETPSAGAYSAILKRWTGASWTKAQLMRYNGSWVAATLYFWTGSEWGEVDVTGV